MMSVFFLIPILAIISATFLYRHNGKREFLKFDFVQFIYAFVITPIFFVWIKSFVFLLLRSELDVRLTIGEIFVIDTILSTIGLYVTSFIVIHSLTKSFRLKLTKEPLHDLFEHSEYFHLWLTHIVSLGGMMVLFGLLAVLNALYPIELYQSKSWFYWFCSFASLIGVFGYVGMELSDPQQGNFKRLMKLIASFVFVVLTFIYFWLSPKFNATHLIYWLVMIGFATMILCLLVLPRSKRMTALIHRFKHKKGWGDNIMVVKK